MTGAGKRWHPSAGLVLGLGVGLGVVGSPAGRAARADPSETLGRDATDERRVDAGAEADPGPDTVPLEERAYLRERPDVLSEARRAHESDVLEGLLEEREALVARRRTDAIDALERFVAEEPETATEMPDALLRLAELRWEEARAAYLEAFRRWESRPPRRRGRTPRPDYRQAVALHDRILERHPDYPRTDLVLYMKAAALLERGEDEAALLLYERILVEHPESRFVPDAHFARAEDLFSRQNDFSGALTAYEAVLGWPDSPFYDLALFKSAWCLWRLDRTEEAALRFRRVLDLANESRGLSLDRRERLRELESEALDYLIQVFLENEGNQAEEVFAFLEDIGGERYAFAVLERLADTYVAQARYESAVGAYARLITMDPSHPRAPAFQAAIAGAWASVDEPEKAIEALDGLATTYAPDAVWASQQGDPQVVAEARRLAERSTRRLALRWHEEGQRDERESRFVHAAALYGVYLSHFSDRPPAYGVQFYRAEVLFHRLERFEAAGAAYLAAARLRPAGDLTRDALYNAIGAFERVREGEPTCPPPPASAPEGSCGETDNDRLLGEAIALYVELFPNDPDLPEILFRQGKLYYDRRVYDPAVRLFGQLIQRFPASPFAVSAGELVLDSFNRAQDWANIETWARRLKETEAFAAPELQARLDGLILQAVFKTGEQLAARGEHVSAAAAYLRAANEFPGDPRAAQALYNAGVERQRAGDLGGAEAAYGALVDGHPGTPEGAEGAWAAAQMYESIAQFGDAARWYETYAGRFPDGPKAADALYDATLLRLAVGEPDAAIENAERFGARFRRHEAAAEVVFLTGRAHEEAGRPAQAARVYRRFLRSTRDLDRKVEASTRLGQVLLAAGESRGADRAFDTAVRLGKRHARRLDRGLYFAAQARFLQGEAVVRSYDAVRIAGDPASLRERLQEKARLLARAAEVFAEVVRFGVAEWVTAALFEIGHGYELFAEALRGAPLPEGLDEEEEQVYLDQLARFVVPMEDRALEAYEGGYRKALELGIYNRWTAALREALTRLNDVAYPPLRETGIRLVEGEGLLVPPPIEGVARPSPSVPAEGDE